MARLILAAALIVGIVGIVAFVSAAAGRSAGMAVRDMDMSNGVNKIAFAALLVLLFGVSTGWLGGL